MGRYNNPTDVLVHAENGDIIFAGHRITLFDIIWHYNNDGWTAEILAAQFPTLELAQIHGALAFYLANRLQLDALFAKQQVEVELQRQRGRPGPGIDDLRQRLSPRRAV